MTKQEFKEQCALNIVEMVTKKIFDQEEKSSRWSDDEVSGRIVWMVNSIAEKATNRIFKD